MGDQNRKVVLYVRPAKLGLNDEPVFVQHQRIVRFVNQTDVRVIAQYCEGSPEDDETTMLERALSHCRSTKAELMVSTLSATSRNFAFIAAFMDRGIPFIVCDMVGAGRLALHVTAAGNAFEQDMQRVCV